MKTTVIKGSIRKETGPQTANAARREQAVPCNLYGGADHVHFTADMRQMRQMLFTPEFHLVELELDGKTYKAIVKEVQLHAVTDAVQHVDFLELVEGKKITVDLPVKLLGNPIGVKNGGKMTQKMRRLRVKTLPQYLQGQIDINVETLDIGSLVRVGDIKLDNIEIMHEDHIPVVSVNIPRAAKVETPAATAAAPAAAPAAAKGAAAPAAGKAAAPVKTAAGKK